MCSGFCWFGLWKDFESLTVQLPRPDQSKTPAGMMRTPRAESRGQERVSVLVDVRKSCKPPNSQVFHYFILLIFNPTLPSRLRVNQFSLHPGSRHRGSHLVAPFSGSLLRSLFPLFILLQLLMYSLLLYWQVLVSPLNHFCNGFGEKINPYQHLSRFSESPLLAAMFLSWEVLNSMPLSQCTYLSLTVCISEGFSSPGWIDWQTLWT